METPDKQRDAFALAHLREQLEKQIENAVRAFESEHSGPIELDMSMVEGEGGAESDDRLRKSVEAIVEAFHRNPVVSETGVRVHKVTAIDSDADGQIAVRVSYDYPVG
jgi:hypothetical protein